MNTTCKKDLLQGKELDIRFPTFAATINSIQMLLLLRLGTLTNIFTSFLAILIQKWTFEQQRKLFEKMRQIGNQNVAQGEF